MDLTGMLIGAFGLALGGILKGATGAGAPIIAVPLLAIYYDVPLAVAIFTFPNFLTNIVQGWQYRAHQLAPAFVWGFAIAGALGAFAGSLLLASLSANLLLLAVGLTTLAYILLRILKKDWALPMAMARRMVWPIGLVAGVLQGAAGVSAPVSVTFLNAIRLERGQFIATVSVFFAAMGMVQIPTLFWLGILTPTRAGLSLLAILPIMATLPVGAWLARRLSRETFDRIILCLLGVVALRLIFAGLA